MAHPPSDSSTHSSVVPNHAATLRAMFASGTTVHAPGVYDAITARIAESCGAPAVYMSGAGVSAARGFPDYGLLTMSEMTASLDIVNRAVDVPVIADADTGYGNELNVARTIIEYERRGVAALHLEDQVFPKRCGHLDGKEVVPVGEYVDKVRAAVDARRGDLVLIARSDARTPIGLDAALSRVNAALTAGADMAFVDAPASRDEIAAIPKMVDGPCVLNLVPGGKGPVLDLDEIEGLGYALVIASSLLLYATTDAGITTTRTFFDERRHPEPTVVTTLPGLFELFGAGKWDARRATPVTAQG